VPSPATRPAGPGPRAYPGPPLRAVPGLLRQLWGDRLGLLSDAAAKYGDVVRFDMGPKTIYFFNHPDHAKHVLTENPTNYRKGMGLNEARRTLGDGLLTSRGHPAEAAPDNLPGVPPRAWHFAAGGRRLRCSPGDSARGRYRRPGWRDDR
jgi:hypothetical protein